MLLLISDANILIDMEDGNLIPVIFQLPYEIAVPDILFELELREQHSHLLQAGLKVKSLNSESVKKTEFLTGQYPRPSMMDHSALALALQEQCPLLTGDKDLRIAAKKEGVHEKRPNKLVDRQLNLSVEVWDYKPVSEKTVVALLDGCNYILLKENR